MQKNDFAQQFSHRLRDALIAAGHDSKRSTSGVNIHKLAEITGYSTQICRKYLRGEAIPDPEKLVEIATALAISPGWLLFGDSTPSIKTAHQIVLSQSVLHHLLQCISTLYQNTQPLPDGIPDFLLDLAVQASQIQADEEELKKMIELAVSSVRYFSLNTPNVQ